MGYSREVYDCAQRELSRRRREAEDRARQNRLDLYDACPRIQEIDQELSGTFSKAARAVIRGSSAKEELTRIRDRNLALQAERAQLLKPEPDSMGDDQPLTLSL